MTTTRWLRIESLALLVALIVFHATTGGSWLLFVALLLVPDVSMAGYLAGPRIGAASYNLAHLYAWPALLLASWAVTGAEWALAPGLIWASHIAMDRALGFGLKEPHSFRSTHLGSLALDGAPAGVAGGESGGS